jgi:hypothetical protein
MEPKMKSFLSFLAEEKEDKHAVLTFGRMNPPTVGHEKVVQKVHEVAKEHNAEHHVVLSGSHDVTDKEKKVGKNPLSPEVKLKHAKRAFPDSNVSAAKKGENMFHHASKLFASGVKHLHMVVGSDRVKDTEKYLNDQNGKTGKHGHFNFKSITVHDAGHRDPDSEGTEGISASKMREHAASNNKKEFHKGAPSKMSSAHKDEMYHDLRKSMGHE